MIKGKCFDCEETGTIYRHRLSRSASDTIPLCPSCHRRRYSCGESPISWMEYLSPEQREIVYTLINKEKDELKVLEELFKERLKMQKAKIKEKYQKKRLSLVKRFCSNKNYTTISYPLPIWTLNSFKYLQPQTREAVAKPK